MSATNRPNHYKTAKYEYKDVVEFLYDTHCNDPVVDHYRFHAMKYLWRLGQKDDVMKELIKAKTFIEFAIERQEKVDKNV